MGSVVKILCFKVHVLVRVHIARDSLSSVFYVESTSENSVLCESAVGSMRRLEFIAESLCEFDVHSGGESLLESF